jgi:hypothetical protein
VSDEEWANALAVNFTATYNSVAVCLPHMLEHGEGSHIVVTSSMSGLLPGGNLGVYTATKIGVVGLIEALRIELEGTTVGTSAFVPGGVNTDNYIGTGDDNPYRAVHPDAGPPNGLPRRQGPPPGMDPIEAGERVLNGVIHNDLFIVTHPNTCRHEAAVRCDVDVRRFLRDTAARSARAGRSAHAHAGIYPREMRTGRRSGILPRHHGLNGAPRHVGKNDTKGRTSRFLSSIVGSFSAPAWRSARVDYSPGSASRATPTRKAFRRRPRVRRRHPSRWFRSRRR